MIKIGMIIGDRYEILEKIGTGGMSDVYKAKCHKLNRFVAVKILKQEFSENANFVSKFRIEAQAAAGLSHPNIVNVFDVGEENGIYYIVMELVEGITLKKYIEKKARLSVKEAISIAIQICMGIEAAHNNHIIHRDIKPQNIIISKEGKVKVTDFGIAKAATSNTITSNVMGSVHYTSPEQARGGFSDAKSDIYSLGITLFEMLTGRVAFNGETTVAIAIKHIQEEMPSPREFVSEIPVSVEQIVFKCCQKSPDRRYQTMAELITDLKKSLMNPDEDFVKVVDPDEEGSTRAISDEEVARIKATRASRNSGMGGAEWAERTESGEEDPDGYREGGSEDEEQDFAELDREYGAEGADTEEDQADYYEDQRYEESEPSRGGENRSMARSGGRPVRRVRKQAGSKGRNLSENMDAGGYPPEAYEDAYGDGNDSYQDDSYENNRYAGHDSYEGHNSFNNNDSYEEDSHYPEDDYEEEYYENNGNDDGYRENDGSYNPRLEKLTTVLAIVAALLIGGVVIVMVGRAFGLFQFDWPRFGQGNENEEQTAEIEQVEMVSVVGKKLEEAKVALIGIGLTPEIEYQESTEYESGIVMKSSVQAGEMVDAGSNVILTTSSGSEGVEVPELVGKTEAEATSLLQKAGFSVIRTESYDDFIRTGSVLSQNPASGSKAPEDSEVTITISLGPKDTKIQMPNLIGQTEMDAMVILQEAGLVLGSVTPVPNDDPALLDLVCYQAYSVGAPVEKGAAVDIQVSTGPELLYRYSDSITGPSHEEDPLFREGTMVTVSLASADGASLLSTSTASFPIPVDFTNIKVPTGVLLLQYVNTIDEQTVTNDDGTTSTIPGSEETKEIRREITFTVQ